MRELQVEDAVQVRHPRIEAGLRPGRSPGARRELRELGREQALGIAFVEQRDQVAVRGRQLLRLEQRQEVEHLLLAALTQGGRIAEGQVDPTRRSGPQRGRQQPPTQRAGHRAREPVPPQQRLVEEVATQRLVGALSRQDHADVLLRLARELVHRDHDGVADGLVELCDDLRQQLDVGGTARDLRVLAAQPPRGLRRLGHLVVGVVDPDRERAHRVGDRPRHGRDDGTRIHATAQVGAQRDVGDQPPAHAALEALGEAIEVFASVAAERSPMEGRLPVALEP